MEVSNSGNMSVHRFHIFIGIGLNSDTLIFNRKGFAMNQSIIGYYCFRALFI